ncbi:hypothetical protein AB1Y20_014597 [Prymnesium parvum]|uniref:Fe2OG dioxygenase domain-containing protein n=1 Tax=Prymnesium parvum TaxID=97485 RepID=A0AB34IB81_PRYPA
MRLPRESSIDQKLSIWLHGLDRAGLVLRHSHGAVALRAHERWAALQSVADSDVPTSALLRLAGIIELGQRGKLKLRRAAAIGLIRLTAHAMPEDERLQAAHARGLALALPRRLAMPHAVLSLIPGALCDEVVLQAERYAADHGWGSLHRRYPTVDLPVSCLGCGAEIEALMREEALPQFARLFGAEYGPQSELTFRDLFVAKYDASTSGAQTGLDGHVDASLLSMVVQLSRDHDFDGGGTFFEHIPVLIRPGQGGAVLFLGKIYHAALPITRGRRYVLVALVDRRVDRLVAEGCSIVQK